MSKAIKYVLALAFNLLLIMACQGPTYNHWDDYEAIEKAFEWQVNQGANDNEWTNATFYIATSRIHAHTNNALYLDQLVQNGNANQWLANAVKIDNADISMCSSFLYLDEINIREAEILPTAKIINQQICSKDSMVDDSIQVWELEKLYTTAPLLVAYAQKVNDIFFIDQMHQAYKRAFYHLYSQQHQLFYSTHFTNSHEPKNNFDLKENGMVFSGLALLLENMPRNYTHRPFYEKQFKTMANTLKKYINADGLWHQHIIAPENETNIALCGSGLCTFALAWGTNHQLLDQQAYQPIVEKAWKTLRQYQNTDGKISSHTTPAFQTKATTSTFMLAGSEIIALKNKHLIAKTDN